MKNTKVPLNKVMEIYGLSRSGVNSLVKKGIIKKYKLGGRNYYDIDQIEKAMKEEKPKNKK